MEIVGDNKAYFTFDIDFVNMDLVEVAPAYDAGEVTALAGASLLLDDVCLESARKRRSA